MFGSRNFLFAKASAVAAEFKLFTWGINSSGQLGLGNTVARSSPVQVGALTDWLTPEAGATHMCCVKTDGTLWAWGDNASGRLGINSVGDSRSSPVQVGALTNWEKPSAGVYNTACIKTDGTLWAWGSNNNGQLGQNDLIYCSSPVQVGSSITWSAVSVGNVFMLAVDNGKLFAWGINTQGQLGLGDTVSRSSPVQVGALTTWAKPSVPHLLAAHALCTKTDGTLWAWGRNNFGQLGQVNTTSLSSPVQVGALTDWVEPSAGNEFSLCVKTDGTLWSWGNNSNARLGLNNFVNRSSPVQVGNLTNWSIPAAGALFAACTKTGTLFSWGYNSYGFLGVGDVVERSSPVQVGSLFTWAKASSGNRFCVSTQGVETSAPISLTLPIVSGTAQEGQTLSSTTGTWGQFPSSFTFQWQRGTSNISGATSSTYEIVAADVGSTLRCVVTATNTIGATAANSANTATVIAYVGKLFSWGSNANGRLGQNNTTDLSSPVQVGALTEWRLIQASRNITAVKTTGQLWAWGNNSAGSLGQNDTVYRSSPTQVGGLTTWAKPGGGNRFALCTKTDGTLWAWGFNGRGQLGQNDVDNRSSPVQVGALTTWATPSTGYSYVSLCVKTDGTLWAWGYNDRGQLGQNDTANRSSPVQVGALTNWKTPVVGDKSVLCTKTDGTLWAWGQAALYGAGGQLGLNDLINRSSPTQVGAETHWNIPSIGAGSFSACTTIDGKLFTWGVGGNGRLGINDGQYSRSSPTQVGGLTNWSVAQAGTRSCVATKRDGTLWSWGWNDFGQLGNGLQNSTYAYGKSSPVQVGALTTWLVPSFTSTSVLCTQK